MSDVRDEWEAAVLASEMSDALVRLCWALRKFANRDGECFPSVNTLAKTYGRNRSTVFRHLDKLAAAGWIERELRGGTTGQGGTTNLYRLTIPESGRTHGETTSPQSGGTHGATTSQSGRSMAATTSGNASGEVVADSNRSSRKSERSGRKFERSGGTHGATRTINPITIIEPVGDEKKKGKTNGLTKLSNELSDDTPHDTDRTSLEERQAKIRDIAEKLGKQDVDELARLAPSLNLTHAQITEALTRSNNDH